MWTAFLAQPITTKNTLKFQHSKLRAVYCEMQGWRKHMEDATVFHRIAKDIFLFAIFDGHSGLEVSKFCAAHLVQQLTRNQNFEKGNYELALQETFKNIDAMLISSEGQAKLRGIGEQFGMTSFNDGLVADSVGCTANVALLVGNILYVANAGDSRAALSRKGQIIQLSYDHKPTDPKEKSRIEKAGGKVENGRINYHLNLSRSMGDMIYKKDESLPYDQQIISCRPDLKKIELCKDDDFLIMGCDGIWQRYEHNGQPLIDLIRNQRLKGTQPQQVLEGMLDSFLAKAYEEQIGLDNMSVILVEFNKLAL